MKHKKKWHTGTLNNSDLDLAAAQNMLMTLPILGIIASMEMQLNILKRRGVDIKDWDNKSRTVEQIRMIGGKVYFLATETTKEQGGVE